LRTKLVLLLACIACVVIAAGTALLWRWKGQASRRTGTPAAGTPRDSGA
jgi:hypothetical protein